MSRVLFFVVVVCGFFGGRASSCVLFKDKLVATYVYVCGCVCVFVGRVVKDGVKITLKNKHS